MPLIGDLSKMSLDALDDLEERVIDKLHDISILPVGQRAQYAERLAALEELRRTIQAYQQVWLAEAAQNATAAVPWRPIGRPLSS